MDQQNTLNPSKTIPLLQQLSRVEELVASFSLRLDPITNHEPMNDSIAKSTTNTVTGRLSSIGDSLQYLLDHMEL